MGRRVLVVDDDRLTLTWASRTLQKAGYTVVSALDAQQAVHREAPEVIVTDLAMPAGGGLSEIERLQLSAHTSSIPIIVLTGSADAAMEARVRSLGVAAVLRKPAAPEALLEAVAAALRGDGASPP